MASRRNIQHLIRQARVCVLLVSVLVAQSSIAQSNRSTEQSSSPLARDALQQVAAKYKIPGMAVALIEHGRLVDTEVFGVREKESSAPIEPRTVFEVGQLSEPVFADGVHRPIDARGHD